ncbi:MAG: efflux RND transporter periplasmic adaptor subunit, partial [Pontibacterium sp.]
MISLKNQLYVPALLSLFIPLNLANASEYVHKVSAHLLQQSDGYLVNRVFTGRVSAMDASNIGFDFGGKVVNIYADLGDRVSKGDLLATQDTIMLSNARRELNAQLTELDAQIALNQANLRRVNALKSKGYASNQQLDELNSQRDVLLASRARILAGLASNQTQLDKAQLLAPYDAIITAKHIGVGNVVAGGSPVFSLDQQGVKQA